jgi:hypothetical protein
MQIDWNYIQSNWDWAGHIVEALVMTGVVTILALSLFKWRLAVISGLAFSIGHFHGREKRDFELSVHMPPPHLRGYFMWDWSWDQATDFWPVALVCVGLLIMVSCFLVRR